MPSEIRVDRDEPAAAANLTNRVVEQIDELLKSGRLVAGQRLIEKDLCDMLSVGRVPVREALRILAGDGVIELVPGRGARVREMSPRQISDMLKVIVGLLFVALDEIPDVADNSGFDAGLQERFQAVQAAKAKGDPLALNDALCAYQEYIVSCSRNDYLIRSMGKVHFYFYTRQVLRYVGFSEVYVTSELYEQITKALTSRKIDVAKVLFAETRDRIVAFLDSVATA